MNIINATPKSILSLGLCIALLTNSITPAFSQVVPPPQKLTHPASSIANKDAFSTTTREQWNKQQVHIERVLGDVARGSLNNNQIARLKQIEYMFKPAFGVEKSAFEQFNETYTATINQEFTRESNSLESSKQVLTERIDKTAQNYRKEVYADLVHSVTEHLLTEQGNSDKTQINTRSNQALSLIETISYNPATSLEEQITQLTQTQDALTEQILRRVAFQAQADSKYTTREQAIHEWKQQANAQLTQWYNTGKQQLKQWKQNATAKAKQVFDKEYQPQLLKMKEEEVKKAVADLWAYKEKASRARDLFLELGPVLLPLRTLDDKSFLSDEQKKWLAASYARTLQNGHTCGDESKHPETACKKEMTALVGLSMAGSTRAEAMIIEEFMQAKLKSAQGVPVLLVGTSALLAMKQYQVLGGFLYSTTRDERNIENIDILSFETLVNLAANINGQYLGEISKYAQYPLQANPTDQTPLANAWEDVAQLLAADGSKQALDLLRQYGVEKCRLMTSTSLTMQKNVEVVCTGIIPFLVGALNSGKSGASQYNPQNFNTYAGYVADQHGTSYVSAEQAKRNAAAQNNIVKGFHAQAAQMGLLPQAMIARHLFLQSMGDLNAESELRIDTQLYKVYQQSLKQRQPKPGFTIAAYTRNSEAYNAKRVRQDRTQFFRKAARWADVGVLIWCVVDISKWAHSGFKIARAIGKASWMARNGATVAQRAMMLRRLNIAPQLRKATSFPTRVSARIKNGMAPSVLAELPHFTSQSVQLPKIEGYVESAGKLVAQNMRFSAQTGVLSADAAAIAQASHEAYTPVQLGAINGMLESASAQANTQFANRSALKRLFTFNKDASYRSTLARQLSQTPAANGLEQVDLHNLAFSVLNSPITVPENIATFKIPSLWKAGTTVPMVDQVVLLNTVQTSLGTDFAPELLNKTNDLLNKALLRTNAQFASRGNWAKAWSSLRGSNNQIYKNMLLNNLAATFDKDGLIFSDANYFKLYQNLIALVKADKSLTAPAWLAETAQVTSTDTKFHQMGSTLFVAPNGATPVEIPLSVQMQIKRPLLGGIKGVASTGYQRVVISEDKKGALLFGFGNDLLSPIKPSQFKLTLAADDLPLLAQAARGYTGPELTLKLTSPTLNSFFTKRWTAIKQARLDGTKNPFTTLLRGKDNTYVHDIALTVRLADGTLQTTPILFKADSYLGLRNASAVLEEGGKLAWYQDGKLLSRLPAMSVGLPKNQIKPMLGLLQNAQLQRPLRVTAVSGKNKIQPLMWATGLSLSSASTGLIAPLENVYGDQITEMDKTWISLAFPYLPSLAAPLFSPLVMKIGALRTLQLALGISTAGLGFAAYSGFRGKIDKENLPPIWPLFVSGMAIGVSSALSRSGLNLLIDSMGGGGTLLKSMAYKNIGSFALLLPPFIANFMDKDIDFSLAFPVLCTLSAASLTWVSVSRISPQIGKVDGFMKFDPLPLTQPAKWLPTLGHNTKVALQASGKEAWSTTRLLATKEVLPLVLAATAFTGFEAGAFSKAGNQMIRPVVKNGEMPGWIPETNRNNYTAMLTNLSVISFPLFTRLFAKPVLKMMETGHAGDEYRRMLKASFALNATGAGLLYANGLDGFGSLGFLGIGLMGMGTANMTQSFQKLSNISVLGSSYARTLTRGLAGEALSAKQKSLVTKTMTGFPVQQLGIAIVPTLVSSYTDRQIDEGSIQKSQAPHSSLWIPISSIVLCFALSAPQLGFLPMRWPNGVFGWTKGIVGSYPGAIEQLKQPQFYLKEPHYGVPPGFTPVLNNPIINTNQIIPPQKTLEKIETKLEHQQAPQPTVLDLSGRPVTLPQQPESVSSTSAF